MKFEERYKKLRTEAEKIVNFTPQEISDVSTDEIQRLFYNLQVYQIELEMQNEEMKKTQNELSISRNRYHFLFEQISVGIVIVNHQGFIIDTNQYFCEMLKLNQNKPIKKHLSSLITEADQNQFINRFEAFFKSPDHKSLILRLTGNQDIPLHVKMQGKLDSGSDGYGEIDTRDSRLIITVTDISDIVTNNS